MFSNGISRYFIKREFEYVRLPFPDDSLSYFEAIKTVSEKFWEESLPNSSVYGFQAMQNSKWRPGLLDEQISSFERSIELNFPPPLRNFYKVMNGLTKPGINLYGSDGTPFGYQSIFYSYPEDLELIKEKIDWIYSSNLIKHEELESLGASRIFPVFQHRFMLIDIPGHPILSMYGDDIIYWTDNLSKLLAVDVFDKIEDIRFFQSHPDNRSKINFWLDKD